MKSNWNEVKIDDICSIRRGASPRPIQKYISERGIPWVKIADATSSNSRFINETKEFIIEEGKEKSRYIEKGTLILSNSATPGLPKFMNINGCVHDGWLILDGFKGVYDNFLYYNLIENRIKLLSLSNGSVFRNLKTDIVKNFNIKLPPLEEQKAIAKILSDLDEKIEVNNKINKNLEEMAQAIFKQWFVDFEFPNEEGKPYKSSGGEMVESELGMIPKGFKVKSIGELPLIITDYVANGSFKSLKENVNMYDEINYAIIVRNTDLKSNFKSDCKYVDKKSYDFLAKSKLFGGELIISNVGDVGSIYLCPKFKKQMTLGSNLIMIDTESSENIGFNLILYRFFKSYIGQYYIKSITGGSAQPKFNKTDFKKIQFINPSNSILKLYNEKNEVIESIIMNNVLENERLEKLRDTLLPKLMSGEIRVPLENNEI